MTTSTTPISGYLAGNRVSVLGSDSDRQVVATATLLHSVSRTDAYVGVRYEDGSVDILHRGDIAPMSQAS